MTEAAARTDRATSKPVHIPTVLVVACSDALLARCWDCLAEVGVMVRDCDPARVATLAAARRPLALVLARAFYENDPDELEALARDVRAELLVVDEDVSERELEASLL